MSEATPVAGFCPPTVNYTNLNEIIASGLKQIKRDDVCVVDLTQLQHCDTTAVCLLLALQRAAMKVNCRLRFHHIGTQLSNLLALYQLTPWFAETAEAHAQS